MWIIIIVCLLAAPMRAQAPAAASEESRVAAVIQNYVEARNARDPKAIEALFTADADQYTTGGEWRRGREHVIPGTARSSNQNPGIRSIAIAAVRFITPDVAIADGTYTIAGSDVRRWTTIVLKRERDEWRIAAIRNMLPTGGAARGTR
jgi:uncharacterized protein (TIGR02246 family)